MQADRVKKNMHNFWKHFNARAQDVVALYGPTNITAMVLFGRFWVNM